MIAKLRELAERALPDGAARQRLALERACSPANILRLIAVVEAAEKLAPHVEPPGDWACAECRPESDILVSGFRCRVHKLRATIDALRKGDGA